MKNRNAVVLVFVLFMLAIVLLDERGDFDGNVSAAPGPRRPLVDVSKLDELSEVAD